MVTRVVRMGGYSIAAPDPSLDKYCLGNYYAVSGYDLYETDLRQEELQPERGDRRPHRPHAQDHDPEDRRAARAAPGERGAVAGGPAAGRRRRRHGGGTVRVAELRPRRHDAAARPPRKQVHPAPRARRRGPQVGATRTDRRRKNPVSQNTRGHGGRLQPPPARLRPRRSEPARGLPQAHARQRVSPAPKSAWTTAYDPD